MIHYDTRLLGLKSRGQLRQRAACNLARSNLDLQLLKTCSSSGSSLKLDLQLDWTSFLSEGESLKAEIADAGANQYGSFDKLGAAGALITRT